MIPLDASARRLVRPALAAALLACSAVLPRTSAAHEYWLEATPEAAAPGDTVAVRAVVGTGFRGELKPYAAPRTVRLQLRTIRDIDLMPAAVNGDLVFARFIVPDAGGALVSYQSNFVPLELPAAPFEAYLRTEGLDAVLAARKARGDTGPGRERYSRCAKTWIAGTDTARLLQPVGLDLEIVPLADPVAASHVKCRVLFQGRPLAHTLVRAWRNGDIRSTVVSRDSVPPACDARTDSTGTAVLAAAGPGQWLLSTVHMIPSPVPGADWQSVWASFTFVRPPAPADPRHKTGPSK